MKTVVLLATALSISTFAADIKIGSTVESILENKNAEQMQNGKSRYDKYCIACHAPTNIMVSSPKPGDTDEWNRRLKEAGGFKKLIASAKKGKGAMPKKGLCTECSDNDLKAAIAYMMNGLKD